MAATLVATVPADSFGPYLGARGEERFVVWVAPSSKGLAWMTARLGRGAPAEPKPLELGAAPRQLGLVAVRAAGADHFVLLWTHTTGEGKVLSAKLLTAEGRPAGVTVDIVGTPEPFLWIDAVATKDGTVVLWAEAGDGEATVMARHLTTDGRAENRPTTVFQGALSWQAVPVSEGVVVVAVSRSARGDRGSVVGRLLDGEGNAATESFTISKPPTARPDIDAVAVSDGVVLGWSDMRDLDSAVYVASLDNNGAVTHAPGRMTRGIGSEAFVGLESTGGQEVYLVWESLADRPATGRSLRIAPIVKPWELGDARATLFVASDEELPDIVATRRGLHALTLARPCSSQNKECADPHPVPFFVELDQELTPRTAEPLRLSAVEGRPATSAWDLSCSETDCIALAAVPDSPTPVYAVSLRQTSKAWASPAARIEPENPPFPTSMRPVAATTPLSNVVMAPVGSHRVVAWLTYFDPATPYERPEKPAPDGRWAPVRAELWVTRFEGDTMGTRTNISYRARSIGGVALSPSSDPAEALLAWSALDQGNPQVFLTLLGENGERKLQKMFTRSAGEVSDVALARVDDGWLVGWVDERHSDPEVYVAKVDRSLTRQGNEERVTESKGAATGLRLVTRGDAVFAVWADARDMAKPGFSDIYLARVSAKDGKPLEEPRRLASSRAHSHSPEVALLGSSVVVAWLQGPSEDGNQPGVALAQLDAKGRFLAPPTRVATGGEAPTSLALDCRGQQCRVVVALDAGASPSLEGFVWSPGHDVARKRLTTLEGAAGQPVPAVLLGSELLYADQPSDSEGRIRLMEIVWQ